MMGTGGEEEEGGGGGREGETLMRMSASMAVMVGSLRAALSCSWVQVLWDHF